MYKKTILILSLTFYILFLIYQYQTPKVFCDLLYIYVCQFSMDSISGPANFFGILALFSLITYKVPNRVYIKWWRFALVSILIMIVFSIIINSYYLHSNSGLFNLDAAFDRLYFHIFYLLFILGSIIQIIRGYYQKE